jgi:hypothetical protein
VNKNSRRESYFFSWENNKQGIPSLVVVFAVLAAIGALSNSWGEKRPVGSFFEEFVAVESFYFLVVGSIWIAGWVGTHVFDRFESKLLGWIAGILVFLGFGFIFQMVMSAIPGVDWRFERLLSSEDDY